MAVNNKMPHCSVETTLFFLGNKWKILIIREIKQGTKRFNELHKILKPISQKVLTSNLRELERNGIINRKIYPIVPPKVEYSLTELGLTLTPVLDVMHEWGEKYQTTMEIS